MSTSVTESPRRRYYRWIVTGGLVVYWLIMLVSTHVPDIPGELDPGIGDKLEHKIAYGLLGFGLGIVWEAWKLRFSWRAIPLLFLVAGLYGMLDELTQPLFGRDCELFDWYADLQGAALGLMSAYALLWAWNRWNDNAAASRVV